MALENATQFQYLKDVVDPGMSDFSLGCNLTSKLASLSFQTVKDSMSTPPALLTPSPPPKTTTTPTTLDFLNTFTTTKKPNFRIEVIKPEDTGRLLEFLRKNFIIDEPLNTAVNLIQSESDRCVELEDFSTCDIHEGLSIMAIGQNGEIKGVVLGCAVHKNDEKEGEDPVEACKNPRFKKILKFLTTMEKKCDIFSFYPNLDSYYELKIVSVDSNCRGEGIASILMKKAFELAKAANLGFVKVDCTSHFSGLIAGKMGFETNYCIPYAEYKENGEVVFVPKEPHTHFRIKSCIL